MKITVIWGVIAYTSIPEEPLASIFRVEEWTTDLSVLQISIQFTILPLVFSKLLSLTFLPTLFAIITYAVYSSTLKMEAAVPTKP
jgi:hypothetical protein